MLKGSCDRCGRHGQVTSVHDEDWICLCLRCFYATREERRERVREELNAEMAFIEDTEAMAEARPGAADSSQPNPGRSPTDPESVVRAVREKGEAR